MAPRKSGAVTNTPGAEQITAGLVQTVASSCWLPWKAPIRSCCFSTVCIRREQGGVGVGRRANCARNGLRVQPTASFIGYASKYMYSGMSPQVDNRTGLAPLVD